MRKNVVIISAAETFSVRGIETKLQGIGVSSVYSPPKVVELKPVLDTSDLIILYTDEDVKKKTDLLIFLKDHCFETDRKIMVIGSRAEYDVVVGIIPGEYIVGFFDRPLVMEKFLDAVENLFSNVQVKRKSILIVDDNVTYMSMIMDWLRDSYRVSVANSGMQAITWLATNHADLILLDYEMPITTGPQVLEMIRSQVEFADIPVMFLTGVSDRDSIIKVMSLKPADYLLKTIDKKGLREKLDNFFQSRN